MYTFTEKQKGGAAVKEGGRWRNERAIKWDGRRWQSWRRNGDERSDRRHQQQQREKCSNQVILELYFTLRTLL